MKIVAISDVHGKWNKLTIPECDILISCGDYSFRGEPHMVKDFHAWLNKQEANYIISLQGNHEKWVEANFPQAKEIAEKECPGVYFIDHGIIEIEGIKFFASAATPYFCNWAWNYYPSELEKHWKKIPDDTNILLTHGPPYEILDELVFPDGTPNGKSAGCYHLRDRIKELKDLKMHFFGHIHCGYGQKEIDGVKYYNVSICDEVYAPSNSITVIDYVKEKN